MTPGTRVNKRGHLLVALLLLPLTTLIGASGCDTIGVIRAYLANDFSRANWDSSVNTIELPMTLTSHVGLPIGVNGSDPLMFALDTGSPAIGIIGNSRTEKLGLELGHPVQLGGIGSGATPEGRMLSNLDLQIGEVEFIDQVGVYLPWQEMAFYDSELEVHFDGIIGYDLLRRYVVELDFAEKVITLHKPESFTPRSDDISIPLIMKMRKPYIDAEVKTLDGSVVPVRLHVDLGSAGTLSLIPDSHSKISIPENAFRSDGMGLSGTVQSYAGRISTLRIGGHALENVTTKFHTSGYATAGVRNGILGLGILKRFRVLFDYPEKRMILRATLETQRPFEWGMTGALVVPYGDGFRIKRVDATTPATKAGLLPGDILTSVDGLPAQSMTYDEITSQLSSGPENIVHMCVQRGDEEHCIDLELERRN